MARATSALIVGLALAAAVKLPIDQLVPLPLGSHGGLLPIGFWAIFVSYTLLLARAAGVPGWPAIVAAVPAGLTAHLAVLISAVPAGVEGYALYVAVVQTLVFGYLVTVVGRNVLLVIGRARAGARFDEIWLAAASTAAAAAALAAVEGRLWIIVAAMSGAIAAVAVRRTGFARRLPRPWTPRTRAAVLVVIVVALALASRELFALRVVRELGADFPLGSADGPSYDRAAWDFVSGTLTDDPGTRWPPGYWLFVAAIYRVFGHDFRIFALVQGALCAAVPALTYVAFRHVFGPATAMVASALSAVSGTLIFVSVMLGTEGVYALLILLAFTALLGVVPLAGGSPPGFRRLAVGAAASGALLALGIAMKPQTLLFALFVIPWLAWAPLPGSRRPFAALALVVGLGLGLLPFVARDLVIHGQVILFAAGGPEALTDSDIGRAWLSIGVAPYSDGWPTAIARALARPLDSANVILANVPIGYLRFFFGEWFGTFDPLLLDRFSGWAKDLRLYGYALAVVGVILALRDRPESRWHQVLALAFVVSQASATVFFGPPQVRYRVPSDPILLMYVSHGAVRLAKTVSGAARRSVAATESRGLRHLGER